ncbi:hypothetical protein PEBR_38070 [Penicillium brasilianum]|uniref:Tetratricopeptide repeat protein n=1 Tax=Penicillium brasilianum TaxID=104259 RepID=A0A1S9RC60_PENBI|nr:hypothetical protein PEBR_38070 [Penicillium brasilianum]
MMKTIDRPASQDELVGADQSPALELLDLIAPLDDLAREYLSNRQFEQGMDFLKYVVVLREKTLNGERLGRLASQHGLTQVYQIRGLVEQVLELSKHAVQANVEHPASLAFEHELGRLGHSAGQIKQALELLEHVVAVQERTLNEEHPDQLASRRALRVVQSFQTAEREQDALVISH